MAPRQHRQAQTRSRRKTPAITPTTMPAIAPPLRPSPLDAWTPITVEPLVATGARKPCVVVGAEVSVTVVNPLLVPRTGGVGASVPVAVAVAVPTSEELPTTHWFSTQTDEASQQSLPQGVSPSDGWQEPEDVAAAMWLLHTEVMVETSVSVVTYVVV